MSEGQDVYDLLRERDASDPEWREEKKEQAEEARLENYLDKLKEEGR